MHNLPETCDFSTGLDELDVLKSSFESRVHNSKGFLEHCTVIEANFNKTYLTYLSQYADVDAAPSLRKVLDLLRDPQDNDWKKHWLNNLPKSFNFDDVNVRFTENDNWITVVENGLSEKRNVAEQQYKGYELNISLHNGTSNASEKFGSYEAISNERGAIVAVVQAFREYHSCLQLVDDLRQNHAECHRTPWLDLSHSHVNEKIQRRKTAIMLGGIGLITAGLGLGLMYMTAMSVYATALGMILLALATMALLGCVYRGFFSSTRHSLPLPPPQNPVRERAIIVHISNLIDDQNSSGAITPERVPSVTALASLKKHSGAQSNLGLASLFGVNTEDDEPLSPSSPGMPFSPWSAKS